MEQKFLAVRSDFQFTFDVSVLGSVDSESLTHGLIQLLSVSIPGLNFPLRQRGILTVPEQKLF